MIKLKIIKINNSCYYLKSSNQEYKINLIFYDLTEMPSVNDYIYMNELLLNENNILNFGALESKYGRNILQIDDKELIVLEVNHKKVYLKRLYG